MRARAHKYNSNDDDEDNDNKNDKYVNVNPFVQFVLNELVMCIPELIFNNDYNIQCFFIIFPLPNSFTFHDSLIYFDISMKKKTILIQ